MIGAVIGGILGLISLALWLALIALCVGALLAAALYALHGVAYVLGLAGRCISWVMWCACGLYGLREAQPAAPRPSAPTRRVRAPSAPLAWAPESAADALAAERAWREAPLSPTCAALLAGFASKPGN